jgi:site-specific recombinase XerD
MTPNLDQHPAASQQAIVDAALLMLQQMGLSPGDLVTAPRDRRTVPTFAEYVPVVSAAVTDGTRRAYGSYWNRVVEHWGERRLDEVAPSEIRQLMSYVKTHVVARRNARGGRSAAEHLVAALRCLYRHAEDDGLITAGENPARKVDKPRRLPSTRRAVTDDRLAEICQAAATGGDDPELDTLLLRLHTETARRRGGSLALRPDDLDSGQCLIQLREKGETVRWQPVSPTLMARLIDASMEAARALDVLTVATRAPSMPLTLAREATSVQSHRRIRLVSDDHNDVLATEPMPFVNSRASTGQAGLLEQALIDRRVSDPVILLRASAIDDAARRLISQAESTASESEGSGACESRQLPAPGAAPKVGTW